MDARPRQGDRRRQKLQKCHQRFSNRAAVSPPPTPISMLATRQEAHGNRLDWPAPRFRSRGKGRKSSVRVEVTMDVSRHFCNFCRLLSRSCAFTRHGLTLWVRSWQFIFVLGLKVIFARRLNKRMVINLLTRCASVFACNRPFGKGRLMAGVIGSRA